MEVGCAHREDLGLWIETVKVPQIQHRGFLSPRASAPGEPTPENRHPHCPIFLSSTFEQQVAAFPSSPFVYTRVLNPTTDHLAKLLAQSEYGVYCRCFSSGMAAIYTLLSAFGKGEHVILSDEVYEETFLVCKNVLGPNSGTEFEFVDFSDLANLERAVKPNTKLVYFETPTNPFMRNIDISAVVRIAKEKSITVAVDNSLASSYLQSPLLLGADVVVASLSKYVAGHSDVSGGMLVTSNKVFFDPISNLCKLQGNCFDPMSSFLTIQGIKTLKLRMDAACSNAFIVAEWLKRHQKIAKVFYGGFEDNDDFSVRCSQMRGDCPVITFVLKQGTPELYRQLSSNLKVFRLAFSFGGVESLARPINLRAKNNERIKQFSSSCCIFRLAVGLEDVEDLLCDLHSALSSLAQI